MLVKTVVVYAKSCFDPLLVDGPLEHSNNVNPIVNSEGPEPKIATEFMLKHFKKCSASV